MDNEQRELGVDPPEKKQLQSAVESQARDGAALSAKQRSECYAMILKVALPLAILAWGSAWATTNASLGSTAKSEAKKEAATFLLGDGGDAIASKVLSLPGALEVLAQGVPIGVVVAWPGRLDELPQGDRWHVCDGSSMLGTDWDIARLRKVLPDDLYDGKLPDFSGMFLRGIDSEKSGRDPAGVRDPGQPQDDMMQLHTHIDKGHDHPVPHLSFFGGVAAQLHGESDQPGHAKLGKENSGADLSNAVLQGPVSYDGGGDILTGPETRPVNIAVHWIIKVK